MQVTQFHTETILFLPGLFGDGLTSWAEVTKHIQSSYVVPQEPLCAVGRSPEALVEAYLPLLGQDSPVTIVGTSYGGMIAMLLAQERPEAVSRVIIADSGGFNAANSGHAFDRHDTDGYAAKLAHVIYHNPDKIRLNDLYRLQDTLKKHKRNVARLMNVANSDLSAPKHLEALGKLGVPVHAIWGECDVVTPLSAAEFSLKKFGATIDVIPDSGHSPMCESPLEFAELVNRRLSRDAMLVELAS